MAFENGSTLNVVYDDKVLGNTIDPTEWNDNFKEIENKDNANVGKFNANFAKLTANTGSAEIGSPAITGLGETADSTVYTQLLLATTAILDRYTKAQIDGYRTSDADKYIANVTLNASKDLVIIWGDGDSQTIALDLEKIPASFGFDQTGTKLVITNQDGTKYEADVSSLLNLYTFNDSSTIDFTTNAYNITATINAGSITDAMLNSDLITQLQGYVTSASASATSANTYAQQALSAEQGAVSSAYDALQSKNNAKTSEDNALASAMLATTEADRANTYRLDAGISESNSEAFATNAKSWAIGTTGTRTGEDTNNAKYWCDQAQAIVGGDFATHAELDLKQNITDNTLTTTDKTIVGAIKEHESDLVELQNTRGYKNARTNLTNADDAYDSGKYFLSTATCTNLPTDTPDTHFFLDVIGYGELNVIQTAVGINTGRTFKRRRVTGTWEEWIEDFSKDGSAQMTGVLKTVGGTGIAEQIELHNCHVYTDSTGHIWFASNLYFNGTEWRYKTDGAGIVFSISGSDAVLTAPLLLYVAEPDLKDAVATLSQTHVLTTETGLPLTGGILTGGLNISNPFANIEMGSGAEIGTPYIDFHSSGTPNDYDVRILVHGGTSTGGQGSLNFYCGNAYINELYKIYGEHNITVSTSAPSSALAEGCQHQVY